MSNNLNGRHRSALSSVDFYRRVPRDLTEATTLGAAMSICAISIMAILFLSETTAFARTRIVTSITLDENTQPQLRLNFNITMLDVHCDFISVDVWDALGTNRQNVTKNVEKWQVSASGDGSVRLFSGRNRDQRALRHDEHEESLDEILHMSDTTATVLTSDNWDQFMKDHEMAFVDMYAPWCVWCQRLAPTWEKFAGEVADKGMPIGVGKIDCMDQANLCRSQRVLAFPTLRWYHNGKAMMPDYKMDRTLPALLGYATRKLELDEKFKEWDQRAVASGESEETRDKKRQLFQQNRPDHPACQVSGHLMVNRVPGNFHIEAKSKNHNLNSAMTNLTHIVHHLSFGDPVDEQSRRTKRILKQVPEEHRQFHPMDGRMYFTKDFHQAYHHYIKVVSTHLQMGGSDSSTMTTYQFLEQSQIVYYEVANVPEARFSYDLSPMSVVVEKESRKWYDYITSLCAIIGGTFTTLGLIDATLYKVLKPKKL